MYVHEFPASEGAKRSEGERGRGRPAERGKRHLLLRAIRGRQFSKDPALVHSRGTGAGKPAWTHRYTCRETRGKADRGREREALADIESKSPLVEREIVEGAPAGVLPQRLPMAHHNEGGAGPCEAHIDASLIRYKANAPLRSSAHGREDDNVLLTPLSLGATHSQYCH